MKLIPPIIPLKKKTQNLMFQPHPKYEKKSKNVQSRETDLHSTSSSNIRFPKPRLPNTTSHETSPSNPPHPPIESLLLRYSSPLRVHPATQSISAVGWTQFSLRDRTCNVVARFRHSQRSYCSSKTVCLPPRGSSGFVCCCYWKAPSGL